MTWETPFLMMIIAAISYSAAMVQYRTWATCILLWTLLNIIWFVILIRLYV